jgi:hypothetical protein
MTCCTIADVVAQPSHTVGKYRLTRLLGSGASGAVMYAFDSATGAWRDVFFLCVGLPQRIVAFLVVIVAAILKILFAVLLIR